MPTETSPGTSQRPRPWLLALLGIVAAGYLAMQMFSGRATTSSVTTTPPRAGAGSQNERVDPAELDVKIETLQQERTPPSDADRNPFRFQPKPPPPPPPMPKVDRPAIPTPMKPLDTGPPQPPPIGNLIKFIGIVETPNGRIGAFSDCRYTFSGRDGEIIEGRFRVVRIQVESAVVEYVDGRGRTTLPLNGQACVGK